MNPGVATRSLFRVALVSSVIVVGNMLLLYLTSVLLARWLGPEDYGDFNVAIGLALLLANVAALGTVQSLPRFLPGYLGTDKLREAKGFLTDHLAAIAGAALVIALLYHLVYVLLRPDMFSHALDAVWPFVPAMVVAQFASDVLTSCRRPLAAGFIALLLRPAIVLALVVGLQHFDTDRLQEQEVLWSWTLAALLALPVYGAFIVRSLPPGLARSEVRRERSQWQRAALPLWLGGILYMALNQTALFILEHTASEHEVGIFAAVNQTALFVSLPMVASYGVVIPHFSPLAERGDMPALMKLVRRVVAGVGLSGVLIAVVIVVFGRTILSWFGPGFEEGYPTLLVICFGNLVIAVGTVIWPLLTALGHERFQVPVTAVALCLNVAMGYALVPRYGAFGAGVAQSVSISVVYLVLLGYYSRHVRSELRAP